MKLSVLKGHGVALYVKWRKLHKRELRSHTHSTSIKTSASFVGQVTGLDHIGR